MTENSKFIEPLAVRIAMGATVRDAASEIGCSESHANRLATEPQVRRRVSQLRSAAIDRAVGILGSAAGEAVTALRSIVNDASQKPSDRIAAARAILSTVAPISELAELRDRVDQLESHHTEARAVA